jgi:Mg2+/Co2+ transporter CorC
LSEQSDVELESDEVSTIGGYVTSHLGHLPASGEKTHLEGYDVTIVAVDERKVLRLHFKRTVEESEKAEEKEAAVAED